MKTQLRIILGALTLHVIAAVAEPSWKEVGEITLTLPKGSSLAAAGHFIRVSFLQDGTAVKRDFTDSLVFSATMAKAIYEDLAKAVVEDKAFGEPPTGEISGAIKETIVVYNGERKKFKVGVAARVPALEKIEAAIDLVRWKKL